MRQNRYAVFRDFRNRWRRIREIRFARSIPPFFTTTIDPEVIRIIFAPLEMPYASVGEANASDWLRETEMPFRWPVTYKHSPKI